MTISGEGRGAGGGRVRKEDGESRGCCVFKFMKPHGVDRKQLCQSHTHMHDHMCDSACLAHLNPVSWPGSFGACVLASVLWCEDKGQLAHEQTSTSQDHIHAEGQGVGWKEWRCGLKGVKVKALGEMKVLGNYDQQSRWKRNSMTKQMNTVEDSLNENLLTSVSL